MISRAGLDSRILFAGIALIPVYAFSSGGLQPSHMFLALFALYTISTKGLPDRLIHTTLFILFLYALSVEVVYAVMTGKSDALINPGFFLFNSLVVGAVYVYVQRVGLKFVSSGLLVAALASLASVLYYGVDLKEMGEGGRTSGTFNNPNQLGYFSVCLLSLTYLLYREAEIRYRRAIFLFGTAFFLSLASLSKAAIIANSLVIFFVVKPAATGSKNGIWTFAALSAVMLVALVISQGFLDDYLFVKRLSEIGTENDSSLASRGYWAILEGSTLQMIFGLGKDNVLAIVGHEVHSTFGTMLNDYGLVGLLLFVAIIGQWILGLIPRYGRLGSLGIFGPAMLYGISHNGTRFSIFWLLVGVSLAAASRGKMAFRQCGNARGVRETDIQPSADVRGL